MRIANVSTNTIRFLDVREGSGSCGRFWRIIVRRGGSRYVSSSEDCRYAPGILPQIIELAPGQTYERSMQPVGDPDELGGRGD